MSLAGRLERAGQRLQRTRASVGPQRELFAELERELRRLEPWYQPIDLGHGLVAPARSKDGHVHSPTRSLDRGLGKWRAFVEPNLPLPLAGARVLEVGSNAGLHLVECLRQGAREGVGVELDDHYYAQARFVARALRELRGRYVPLRVYQGAMETFEWPLLGRFDLALLLNVIYHVGRVDRRRLPDDETLALQVKAVRGVGQVARFLVFAANPLEDEGYGKGVDSLHRIVREAGLEIVRDARYDHPRGYVLVAMDPHRREAHAEVEPARLVNKYFLPAAASAEKEYVDEYVAGDFDVETTRYYRLRTGEDDWTTPDQARLPAGVDPPPYWIVPWSFKPRETGEAERTAKRSSFPRAQARFHELIDSILADGFDASRGRIRAYRLVHPERGEVYQYIDGNQRIGVLAHLAERGADVRVPIVVEQEFRRERLLDYPLTRQLVEEGWFAEADAYRWFDHALEAAGAGARS